MPEISAGRPHKRGEPMVPKGLKLPASLKERLEALATANGITFTDLAIRVFEAAIEHPEQHDLKQH